MDYLLDSGIIGLLTPIAIAIVGGFWTYYQFRVNIAYNKARIHFDFQQQFKAFQSTLPNEINSRDADGNYNYTPPKGKEEEYKRKLEGYWWFVFDEWFVCRKQCKIYRSLWKNYYSKGVLSALERTDFKEALSRLLAYENSFLGQDEKFKNEINRIYKKKYGVNIL